MHIKTTHNYIPLCIIALQNTRFSSLSEPGNPNRVLLIHFISHVGKSGIKNQPLIKITPFPEHNCTLRNDTSAEKWFSQIFLVKGAKGLFLADDRR